MKGSFLLFAFFLTVSSSTVAQMATPEPYKGQVTTGVTPHQDTAFKRAMAVKVTARLRFMDQLQQSAAILEATTALTPPPSAWERAMSNMAMLTPDLIAPTPEQVMAHKLNLQAATYVPGVLLYPMGTGNLQVGLGAIGRFIGIVEDVSPRLVYSLPEASEVRIAVYSSSALEVRLLFKGIQPAGAYTIDWNGLDDLGHEVVRGDYVAEITIGQNKIIRKRIMWPPTK